MIPKSESPILSSEKSFNQALTHDRSPWREGDGEKNGEQEKKVNNVKCILFDALAQDIGLIYQFGKVE